MSVINQVFRPRSLGMLAVCWLLFRLFFAHISVDPEATAVLRRWIAAEYVRYHVGREDIALSEKAELLRHAQALDFVSVDVRGKPERMVFRVEVASNPAQPPNSRTVRYFRMEHSLLLGWQGAVPRPADAVVYFLAFFML